MKPFARGIEVTEEMEQVSGFAGDLEQDPTTKRPQLKGGGDGGSSSSTSTSSRASPEFLCSIGEKPFCTFELVDLTARAGCLAILDFICIMSFSHSLQ